MLSNLDNNATALQKILCTELIVSVTFNYKVCNIWGTMMAHDPLIISDESMKV